MAAPMGAVSNRGVRAPMSPVFDFKKGYFLFRGAERLGLINQNYAFLFAFPYRIGKWSGKMGILRCQPFRSHFNPTG